MRGSPMREVIQVAEAFFPSKACTSAEIVLPVAKVLAELSVA